MLSWSFSRHQLFELCERKYNYHYYLSKGGWKNTASEETQKAFQLKKLVTLPMVTGSIAHDVIENAILNISNEQPDSEELYNRFTKELHAKLKNQEVKLFEKYYNSPDFTKESFAKTLEKFKKVFDNFLESKTWHMLLDEPDRFKALSVEQFDTFKMSGIPVYAAMDLLLYDEGNDLAFIVDWKTGKPNSYDRIQLLFYSLYAMDKYNLELGRIVCVNEYLSTGEYLDFMPDEQDLEMAYDIQEYSISDMKDLLIDVDNNIPLQIGMFEAKPMDWKCASCSFKEICGDRFAEGGDTFD